LNYFFFLDHPDQNLISSVELFNRPPMSIFFKKKVSKKNIYLFYVHNNLWKNEFYKSIDSNESVIIKKTDLPLLLQKKTIFIGLTSKELSPDTAPFNDDSMKSIPAWRANIRLSSEHTTTSYQGEIPGSFLNLKLSLTSCTPFIQVKDNIENFFYLINMNSNPIETKFNVEVLNSQKKILKKIICKTNCINITDLSFLREYNKENMFIFRSQDHGGIPLYFARTIHNKSLSLEHTHPPQEYLFLGKRNFYQKKKKSFWLND